MLASTGPNDPVSTEPGGGEIVQSAHPRDIGALVLVVGVLLVLFVLSVMLGSPTPLTPARIDSIPKA